MRSKIRSSAFLRNIVIFLATDPLIAYRGEPKDYGETKLMPSLFRESGYIEKERYLFDLLVDHGIVSSGASNVEKAIEAQHYAGVRRMLDISFDALVALFFARDNTGALGDEDGQLYVFAFPASYSPHSQYADSSYSDIFFGKSFSYFRNFKVFSHSCTNDRITAQKGGFIFFPGREFCPINMCYYATIAISKQEKQDIRKALDKLFQVNEAALFPEKDKIAIAVKEKFQSGSYTQRGMSLADEIDVCIERIGHELKVLSLCSPAPKRIEVLRRLRKEEDDLTSYILSHADGAAAKGLIRRAKHEFQILRIRYGHLT